MAFPANPSNNSYHHQGEKLWQYNNGVWTRNRNAGITFQTTSASNINSISGNWYKNGWALNKPIPPNRRFNIMINMYGSYLDDLNLDGERIKYTVTAYEGSTYLDSIFYQQYVPDTYRTDQFRHTLHFEFPWRVSQGYVTRMNFRCDWYISQIQAGNWVQWNWDWVVISD